MDWCFLSPVVVAAGLVAEMLVAVVSLRMDLFLCAEVVIAVQHHSSRWVVGSVGRTDWSIADSIEEQPQAGKVAVQ